MSLSASNAMYFLVAAIGILLTLRLLRETIALRLLPRDSGSQLLPHVSVVIAARDEEARIDATVRQLLVQEGVELQVIVVDDRSTDRTGEILKRIAAGESRLTVVRVDELPDGWLGKCHACEVGAARATGEWILFTDGDIWLKPDVVARAVRQAEAERVDHVTLMPGVRGATFFGAIVQLIFNMALAKRAAAVNRDRAGAYLGIGAFNLVRADIYRAIGGHVPLRMEVVDDIKLGLLVRRIGARTRVYFAPGDADADWCPSIGGMIRDLQKNHFAATGYRLTLVLLAVAIIGLFWLPGIVGPMTGTVAGMAAGLGLLSLSIPAAVTAVRLRLPIAAALLVPLFLPVMAICLLNSAVVTLRRCGVRLCDMFYPLHALRAGLVR